MCSALLVLTAFLQAGGVVPGRSCEPGGRFVSTAGSREPHAAAVAAAIAEGVILAVTIGLPEAGPAPSPAP